MKIIAEYGDRKVEYNKKETLPVFIRPDANLYVPNDGYEYYQVKHSIDFLGTTRNKKFPVPAVVHKGWGTSVLDNRDYLMMTEYLQRFFYSFIDSMTKGLLKDGNFIGYFYIKNNPKLKFHDYERGTKKWIYSRMYQDAVWATDASSFTTGAKDYVLGLNMDSKEVWQYLSGRPTTGALLRLKQNRGSILRFECLDSLGELPSPYELKPHQYYWCTQEHPDGKVTRFPQYKEALKDAGINVEMGTPSPLIAPGGWFEMYKKAVTKLEPGQIWSPYRN